MDSKKNGHMGLLNLFFAMGGDGKSFQYLNIVETQASPIQHKNFFLCFRERERERERENTLKSNVKVVAGVWVLQSWAKGMSSELWVLGLQQFNTRMALVAVLFASHLPYLLIIIALLEIDFFFLKCLRSTLLLFFPQCLLEDDVGRRSHV